jgi:hypothetical protein
MKGPAIHRSPTIARPRWFVPTLAAAAVALLVSTGFLYWQTTRLRAQATALSRQVEDQRHWMAELELAGSDPIARTAALAGRSPWNRALSRQDKISVASLRSLLERAPRDRVILSRNQVEAVLRNRISLFPPILKDVLSRIESGDGVTVDELLEALDGLGINPETTVPTAELVALLS